MKHVAVVGASLAGFKTVEALRSKGFDGRITLIGSERHLPYDRPPLSKQVLLSADAAPRNWLTDAAGLHRLNVDAILGREAVELRRGVGVSILLENGDHITCDRVVLATGATARQPLRPLLDGVHTLRTIDDALTIRSAFATASRLAVVGGGFIGAEVAAAARSHGLEVTIIEALSAPLARVVGEEVGQRCAALHRENGVRVLCGVPVHSLEGDSRVSAVRLANDMRVPADLVVVGVGVVPQTEWLTTSGLTLRNGVVCDAYGAADPSGTVFAVGDVSRWWHPRFGESLRVEHWSHAVEQSHAVAHNLLERESMPLLSIPYVWSDQYEIKIQVTGRPGPECDVWISTDDATAREFTALYGRHGELEGAVAFGRPQDIARARRLISDRVSMDRAIEILSQTRGTGVARSGSSGASARPIRL